MSARECTDAERAGRLKKAVQFLETAEVIADDEEFADAQITMCVHAGIAAADVVCCARLGKHSAASDHAAAIEMLAQVDTRLAGDLRVLLGMKTRAGYGAAPMAKGTMKQAIRAARKLVDAARRV